MFISAKPPRPRAYWAVGPPCLQSGSLPHPSGPTIAFCGVHAGPQRYQALRAQFSVSRANRPVLVHTGLCAPHAFKVALSRILQVPTIAFWGVPAGPNDIEPIGLDFRFRAPSCRSRMYFAPTFLNLY